MPIAMINVGLVAATIFLGLHYVTDLIGTAALLAASLVMYRRWCARAACGGEGAERRAGRRSNRSCATPCPPVGGGGRSADRGRPDILLRAHKSRSRSLGASA